MNIRNKWLLPLAAIACATQLYGQDGMLDMTFAPASGANAIVQRMALQPDGKIVIAGSFTDYDGAYRRGVARVNTDGTLDASFDPGSGIPIDWGQYARAVALQSDGKVLIGGVFTNYNGNFSNYIARVNPDGSYDASFSSLGVNGEVDVIAVQPDGKILVGGPLLGADIYTSRHIVRLKPNGEADSTFTVGTALNNAVGDIALQPDGKIIIAGTFTQYGGTTVNRIARLNSDGSLDNTFNAGTGADNHIQAVTLLPDGKILVTGWFHTFDGAPRWNVARLNADGSLDASYVPNFPAIPATYIDCHAVQQDGKAVVNASWTRLYANGEKDTTDWHNGSYAGGAMKDIIVQPDGKILVCGGFTSFDGIGRNRILRLNGTSTAGIGEIGAGMPIAVFPNPGNGTFRFASQQQLTDLRIVNLNGETVFAAPSCVPGTEIDLTGQPAGVYFFSATDGQQLLRTGRFVIE